MKTLIQTSKVLILSIAVLSAVSYVQAAWSNPTQAPTGGNAPTPINVSGSDQDKDGIFTAAGIGADEFCLTGSGCIEEWPPVGDGNIDASLFLRKTGGTMTGNINMNRNIITGLEAPVADGDVANKRYVDDMFNAVDGGGGDGSVDTSLTQGSWCGMTQTAPKYNFSDVAIVDSEDAFEYLLERAQALGSLPSIIPCKYEGVDYYPGADSCFDLINGDGPNDPIVGIPVCTNIAPGCPSGFYEISFKGGEYTRSRYTDNVHLHSCIKK